MSHQSEVFSVERAGHVATLWLDNPDKRNAMGADFWTDLPQLMTELGSDDEVRAVVIAAKGKHFTAGLDLTMLAGAEDNQSMYAFITRLQASISSVAECPKPVIAAVHGVCLGGGIDLITACDVRLASEDAVFSVRETRMAIVADVGTLQRLPKVLTAGHVAELVYTGKDINAARAREIGLVNDVFADHDAVVAAAHAMATEIAANSPLAVQGAKAILHKGENLSTAQALDFVALWNTAFIRSDDLKEAVSAFFEKRDPKFTGR